MKTSENNPAIFLTDYASYNDGSQFEFGHWVDLTQFDSADEFEEYCTKHFEAADKKRPIDEFTTREERMITDYENFPACFYSESSMDFEGLFEYLNLSDEDKVKVAFIVDQGGYTIAEAMDKRENVYLTEDEGNRTYWDLFEQFYPEAEAMSEKCSYVTIDYEKYIDENYTRFEHEGITYLIDDSWNH